MCPAVQCSCELTRGLVAGREDQWQETVTLRIRIVEGGEAMDEWIVCKYSTGCCVPIFNYLLLLMMLSAAIKQQSLFITLTPRNELESLKEKMKMAGEEAKHKLDASEENV